MTQRPDNLIEALKLTITETYNCQALYQKSVLVEERIGNQIWVGPVEVFELQGHPDAHQAYGWWEEKYQTGLVVVLAFTDDTDAGKAIQAYLMSQE